MKVAIFFGSLSDKEVMAKAARCLEEFEIPYEANIMSAHRVPEHLEKTLERLEAEGTEVFIAGAGLAAHLPGVVASKTTKPVIGVPLVGAVDGMDALFSIVQMPKQIPVATVGINNAYNAGMLAVQMLALKYPEVAEKLTQYRKDMKAKYIADNGKGVEL